MTASDQVRVADEEIDPHRILAERESRGVLRIIRDAVVLEHADRSCVDQREITVGRIMSLDRVAVLLDLRIGIRHLDAVVPPAFHMGLEEPAADKMQILFTQRRERVRHTEIMGARVGRVTSTAAANLNRRRGEYGIDAPYVPLWMGVGAVVAFAAFFIGSAVSIPVLAATAPNLGLALAASLADYLYASRYGKFAAWRDLLLSLGLRGDERVLDMGCGRGAILLMAARLLPRGRAEGIDLWKTSDQSGNALEVTKRNAELEGVADRVDLRTGDMRALPFKDESFDVVLSSLAIHNIADAAGRAKAIDEAIRVLRQGGRVLIADINATREYETRLRERGMVGVERRSLGPRMWFGGPWVAASLVRARKPSI